MKELSPGILSQWNSWGYVNNPKGGFMGFYFSWREWGEISEYVKYIYLQLENHAEIVNGEEKLIFKDPKTDDGTKKSQKGMIDVFIKDESSEKVELVSKERIFSPKTFNGWSYGFYNSIIDQGKSEHIYIGSYDVDSAETLQEIVWKNQGNICFVYVHAPEKVRLKRYTKRDKSFDRQELERRFLSEKEQYAEKDFFLTRYAIFYENAGVTPLRFRKLVKKIKEKTKGDK